MHIQAYIYFRNSLRFSVISVLILSLILSLIHSTLALPFLAQPLQAENRRQPAQAHQDRVMPIRSTFKSSEEFADLLYLRKDYNAARIEYEKLYIGAAKIRESKSKRLERLNRLRTKTAFSLIRLRKFSRGLSYLRTAEDYPSLLLRLYASLRIGRTIQARQIQTQIWNEGTFKKDDKDFTRILGGSLILNRAQYAQAQKYYEDIGASTKNPKIQKLARRTASKIARYRKIPRKMPLLAGLLSAVLPGSGQWYAEHHADAFTALFFNTMFLGSAAVMYNLENRADSPHTASIFFALIGLVFYLSNVVGAIGSAKRWNLHQERLFQSEIRDDFLNPEFVERASGLSFTRRY